MVKNIKSEITREIKQAIRDGKNMDEFEFDQEKFKTVNQLISQFYLA